VILPQTAIFGCFNCSPCQAYWSGGTLFDLSKPFVYWRKGQQCVHPETEPFRL